MFIYEAFVMFKWVREGTHIYHFNIDSIWVRICDMYVIAIIIFLLYYYYA